MKRCTSGIVPAILLVILLFVMPFRLSAQAKQPVLKGTGRVKMFAAQAGLRASSPYKDLHWQYIGPTNISGRCTDVEAVSPRGGQYTIWVGSATGGVWKSVNEGTTFESVFDEMPTASIGDIAIDPKNPEAYANRGLMKTRAGLFSDSIDDFNRSIELGRIILIRTSTGGWRK